MPSLSDPNHLDAPMICPYCESALDGNSVASPGDDVEAKATPDVGQLGLCFVCAGIQVYDEKDGVGFLRKPTDDEEEAVKGNTFLHSLQARIMNLRHGTSEDERMKDPEYDPDAVDQDKVIAKIALVLEEDMAITTRIRISRGLTADRLVRSLRQMADVIESNGV